jgi:hypothetical protein
MSQSYDTILAMNNGRADLLARCIIHGVAEPGGHMNTDVMLGVAHGIVEWLSEQDGEEPANRAIAWAMREDVSPELAILVWSAARRGCGSDHRERFLEKYSKLIMT